MDYIIFVKKENVQKAEGILRADTYEAAKESINVKDASTLGIEAEGSFFYISGTDKGVEKCKEMIKEFVEEIEQEKLDQAKNKIKEEEEKAAEAMGGIFNI